MAIESLLHILNQLTAIHEQLLELARAKREVLIQNKVDDLNAIVNKETRLVRQLSDLEKQRAAAVNAFLQTVGISPEPDFTVADLTRLVFNAKEKQTLMESQQKLLEILYHLKLENDTNQKLIEQSLAFIDFSIELMAKSPDQDLFYQNPAKKSDGPRAGMFDTKA